MTKVLMRATDKMPDRQARRMQYRTRMMTADIQGGGEFEVPSSDARILRKAGWAEDVTAAPVQAPRPRGRPPKVAAPEPEPAPGVVFDDMTVSELRDMAEDPYTDKSVADLRALAAERGIALPSGYVKRDDLIEYLEGKKVHEPAEEDDGA